MWQYLQILAEIVSLEWKTSPIGICFLQGLGQCVLYCTVNRKLRFIMFFKKSVRFEGYKVKAKTAHFAVKK
jgi:hypothetical protein